MNLQVLGKRMVMDALRQTAGAGATPNEHLAAAIDWVCAAQDSQPNGGVSLRYSLRSGWDPSYPETTGYIIPTFLEYAVRTGRAEFTERAMRMADWEVSIQNRDGSFEGGALGSGMGPFVFDTGQILFGLIAAYRYTKRQKYLDSAMRAGKWLVEVQNAGGMWDRFTFNAIPHVYYTRVAWALADLGCLTSEAVFKDAAQRNCSWVLGCQQPNGWFDRAGFTEQAHASPYTHTISYTLEGLIGTGLLLDRREYINAVLRAVVPICSMVTGDGFWSGCVNPEWRPASKSACMTGSAQLGWVCGKLYQISGDTWFLQKMRVLNRYVSARQQRGGPRCVAGAISGSYPIWGSYQRLAYPNWAAKFFADSLMLEMDIDGAGAAPGRTSA